MLRCDCYIEFVTGDPKEMWWLRLSIALVPYKTHPQVVHSDRGRRASHKRDGSPPVASVVCQLQQGCSCQAHSQHAYVCDASAPCSAPGRAAAADCQARRQQEHVERWVNNCNMQRRQGPTNHNCRLIACKTRSRLTPLCLSFHWLTSTGHRVLLLLLL